MFVQTKSDFALPTYNKAGIPKPARIMATPARKQQ